MRSPVLLSPDETAAAGGFNELKVTGDVQPPPAPPPSTCSLLTNSMAAGQLFRFECIFRIFLQLKYEIWVSQVWKSTHNNVYFLSFKCFPLICDARAANKRLCHPLGGDGTEHGPKHRPLSGIKPVFAKYQIHGGDVYGHDDGIISVDTTARWHQGKKKKHTNKNQSGR